MSRAKESSLTSTLIVRLSEDHQTSEDKDHMAALQWPTEDSLVVRLSDCYFA